jgi:hypothetical protein
MQDELGVGQFRGFRFNLFDTSRVSRILSVVSRTEAQPSSRTVMKTTRGTYARGCQSVLLFVLLCLASSRFLVSSLLSGNLFSENSPIFYQAATLGFNYFEFGAVRRGLGGSLAYLLSDNLLVGTIRFHMLMAAAVAATVATLFYRLDLTAARRLAFAVVSLAIMLRWAGDAGRMDMAIATFLALSTIAVQRGRLDWASAAVGAGIFVHESSLIFGGPLLVALVLMHGGLRGFSAAVKIRAALALAIALGCYALMGYLPHSDVQSMVDTVRSKLMPHLHVDWALYFAVSGTRGVATSICQNWTDPSYWTHPFGGAVVLVVVYVALAGRRKNEIPIMLIAAIPPFAFLCIVANDTARWTMLASFNLWLVSSSAARTEKQTFIPSWLALAAALILLPLILPASRIAKAILNDWIEQPIYSGSPAIEWVLQKAGAPRTPSLDVALERCDPDWRRVLDGVHGASSEP